MWSLPTSSLQVFDVQRKITYKNLANWYKELREYRPEIPCCVVANKIDGESGLVTALMLANNQYFELYSTRMYELNMVNRVFVISRTQRIWRWRREALILGRRKDFPSTLCLQQMERMSWRSKALFVSSYSLSFTLWPSVISLIHLNGDQYQHEQRWLGNEPTYTSSQQFGHILWTNAFSVFLMTVDIAV